MDKLSRKILQHIRKSGGKVSLEDLICTFGDSAKSSAIYLENEHFIKSGKCIIGIGQGMKPIFQSNGLYEIQPRGREYLEDHPWDVFDRWSTRVIAIWGSVTGTIALFLELLRHFLSAFPK